MGAEVEEKGQSWGQRWGSNFGRGVIFFVWWAKNGNGPGAGLDQVRYWVCYFGEVNKQGSVWYFN